MPLKLPQYEANGDVVPHDHPGILPEDGVIRRISDQQLIFDDKIGGRRISSKAFKSAGSLSVDLQRQIEEAGLDARHFVTNPRWIGSIRFQAGPVRATGFKIGYNPLIDNPYHGEIWGNFNSKASRRKLRELCEWFVPIQGAIIGDE